MLKSCDRCGARDPRRMIALMALWFGRHAGLPSDGGYFYLCPACYHECIEPHLEDVLRTLMEQHPFLHRLRDGRVDGKPGSGEVIGGSGEQEGEREGEG